MSVMLVAHIRNGVGEMVSRAERQKANTSIKLSRRYTVIIMSAVAWLLGHTTTPAQSQTVTFAFGTPVETCKTKTKIDKIAMTTNVTTTCTINVNFVASNTGTENTKAFSVLLWAEEGDSFVDNGVFLVKKVKALKAGKSATIRQKAVFTNDQAGTFFYLTDTNLNVLASVPIQ
jgi:hypothetical protein